MPTSRRFSPEWQLSPLRRTIGRDEIHVWAWFLEAAAVDPLDEIKLLDQQELERLRRFHFVADRQRYAAAHVTLRRILGAYLGQPPEAVSFAANRFGKPELADASSSLCFNLSHSRTVAVAAVGCGHPLGVDVEDIRPIEPGVAETHFSAAELSELRRLGGEAWLNAFYRCWTRKEAILKAEGIGLQIALDSFDVGLGAQAELIDSRRQFSCLWKLHHLAFCPGIIGAVATAPPEARLFCFSV
ncbi:MAG: 4'-phosphopantetheinyl transferase superfamily protein [Acidobacteriaceae bacterium]